MSRLQEACDRLVIGFEPNAARDFVRASIDAELREEDDYLVWRAERDAELSQEAHESWLDDAYAQWRWERDGGNES